MKIWEFAKVEGSTIRIDDKMAETMGIVEGGCVYSTIFKHPEDGPKDYEIILSMFPQENYRTLTQITMYLDDVPGSSAQAAAFLADRQINVLNSISLNGISDTVIVWRLMADMNFAGEGEILLSRFHELRSAGDASVSKIRMIELKPADVGRLFKTGSDKKEIRRGYPVTIESSRIDIGAMYGDILGNVDGETVLFTMDPMTWVLSVTFFKKDTRIIKAGMEIPDCPGGMMQALDAIAGMNVNLISVFSKVKISYQTMYLELTMDIGKSGRSPEEIRSELEKDLEKLNGIFTLVEFNEMNRGPL